MKQNETSAPAGATLVEAARYALLRRLAFAIRHEMMAHLQPISMTGEVLERRLRAEQPNLDQVRESVGRITGYSRSAVQACLDVVTWLAPEPGRSLPTGEAVAETLELLGSSLGFRGFVVRNEVGEAPWPVLRTGLRHLLPASLLLLTDGAGPPAEITITASLEGARVRLGLALEPAEGPEGEQADPPYRPLSAAEIAAMAQAEGIGFSQQGDTIELLLAQAPQGES